MSKCQHSIVITISDTLGKCEDCGIGVTLETICLHDGKKFHWVKGNVAYRTASHPANRSDCVAVQPNVWREL